MEFGNNVIFRCVIEELNYLYEQGIAFDLPDFKGVIHFELGLILGDNLGLQAITGFVESFSANFSCSSKTSYKNSMFGKRRIITYTIEL